MINKTDIPETMLEVQWFTDPLCAWSFAAEEPILEFKSELGKNIVFYHRMVPLYQSLEKFLSAHKMNFPAEFALKIKKASKATGVAMTTAPWERGIVPEDGHFLSKWVLAAISMDPVKGDKYLHLLRRAFFVEGRDLTKTKFLKELGKDIGLDPDILERLSSSEIIQKKLQEDMQKGSEEGVSVRPTLVIVNSGGDRVFIGGLRDARLFIHAAEVLIKEA